MLSMLGKNSADDTLKHFSYCSRKTSVCKLSPRETICMKCQTLFSGESKKKLSFCCLLNVSAEFAHR